jgi:tRNA threonylcarbamoyladenosine biosynthesis protein TsaE
MKADGLDEAALADLATRVAGVLHPGDVVVLSGEVGAGKTTFVRAAARTLGVTGRITSPTYQFARAYEGTVGGEPVTVNHLDLYRLEGIEAPDALEIDDYLGSGSVTFMEWAGPALEIVDSPTVVRLEHETQTTRRATITGPAAGRLSP